MSEDHTTDNAECSIEGQFSDASFYSTGQIGNVGITTKCFLSCQRHMRDFLKFKIIHRSQRIIIC